MEQKGKEQKGKEQNRTEQSRTEMDQGRSYGSCAICICTLEIELLPYLKSWSSLDLNSLEKEMKSISDHQ